MFCCAIIIPVCYALSEHGAWSTTGNGRAAAGWCRLDLLLSEWKSAYNLDKHLLRTQTVNIIPLLQKSLQQGGNFWNGVCGWCALSTSLLPVYLSCILSDFARPDKYHYSRYTTLALFLATLTLARKFRNKENEMLPWMSWAWDARELVFLRPKNGTQKGRNRPLPETKQKYWLDQIRIIAIILASFRQSKAIC